MPRAAFLKCLERHQFSDGRVGAYRCFDVYTYRTGTRTRQVHVAMRRKKPVGVMSQVVDPSVVPTSPGPGPAIDCGFRPNFLCVIKFDDRKKKSTTILKRVRNACRNLWPCRARNLTSLCGCRFGLRQPQSPGSVPSWQAAQPSAAFVEKTKPRPAPLARSV
jgi:hypothetical protein